MNNVKVFSKMTWPVALSFVSTAIVTEAALPLSNTSRILHVNNELEIEIPNEWNKRVAPRLIHERAASGYRSLDRQILFAMKQLRLQQHILVTVTPLSRW